MPDQVAEIKSKLNLVELINERVPLKQRGRRFAALCPFHSEKTPSFFVSPELNIFKCFGCGASGDAYSFLQQYEGMSFVEALEYLAERTGVKLERRAVDRQTVKLDKKILAVNQLASEYFHFLLTKHRVGQKGLKYLKSRKVEPAAINHFFLGYALDRWDGLFKFLTKKGYDPELLGKTGLVIRSEKRKPTTLNSPLSNFNFYDRFRGRIIFPLRDPRGQVVGFAGRLIEVNKTRPSESSLTRRSGAKYINSPETPVYHKGRHLYGIYENRNEVHKADGAILVEGELDAISSWQAGVRQTLAIKGTALTADQVKLVRRYTRNIRMALDADEAGWEALRRSLPILEQHNMNTRVILLPVGSKDPDDLARDNPQGWRELTKKAVGVYQALVEETIKRGRGEAGEQKKQASELLVPILAGIKNAVEQDHWIKRVAQKLQVREESVRHQIAVFERIGPQEFSSPTRLSARPQARVSREEILSRYLLALILQAKQPVSREFKLGWLEPVGVRKIISTIRGRRFDLARSDAARRLRAALPKELYQLFDDAVMVEIGFSSEAVEDEAWVRNEISQTLRELQRLWIRRLIKKAGDNPEQIARLAKKLGELDG